MKPFDVRLLRYARGITPLLAWGTLLGVVRAIAILAWAWSIAHLIAWFAKPIMVFDWSVTNIGRVFEGLEGDTAWWVTVAIAAVITRGVATWAMNHLAERGAATVKEQLRGASLAHIDALGPGWVASQSEAALTLKLSRGLDALDNYFSQYLPQLMLTVTVTPVLVVVLLFADPLSAVIVIVVFPIIPVFMVLIGLATRGAQERQWRALGTLAHAYLDMVRGLPTLKLFRREGRQATRVREITEQYRARTMAVLRVTFLSGFVLDLAGTFSVALVAVTVGTKLVDGAFPLALAMFVLLLVPEIFVPIRQVGAAFHASSEGLTAAHDVFEILEARAEPCAVGREPTHLLIEVREAQAVRGGEPVSAALSFTLDAGEIVALTGPSGVGKTSVVNALIGVQPYLGEVRVAPFAWSGQRPGLIRGTVESNVALGAARIDHELVRRSLDAACLHTLDPETPLGTSGEGVSGGQAQRIAFARALYRLHSTGSRLLILDEPTSALDIETENMVMRSVHDLAQQGVGVLVVSHRAGVVETATRVIRVRERVKL